MNFPLNFPLNFPPIEPLTPPDASAAWRQLAPLQPLSICGSLNSSSELLAPGYHTQGDTAAI